VDESRDRARAARAALRKSWPIRTYRLGEEPAEDLSGATTASERLAMMWPLALDAWASTGRPLPDYPRRSAPIRILRIAVREAPSKPGCRD
jgi:hypothetical protein